MTKRMKNVEYIKANQAFAPKSHHAELILKSINLTLTNNDNTIVLFYWQFHRFANALSHTSNRVRVDVAVEISTVLYTHQMFDQNTLATVDVRIVVNLCKN